MGYKSFFSYLLIIFVFFQIIVSASEQTNQDEILKSGPYSVGFKHFVFQDETRTSVIIDVVSGSITKKYIPREIKIYLWYPAKGDKTQNTESLNLYIGCMKTDFARGSKNEKIEPMVLMNFPLGKGADKSYLKKILQSPVLAHKDAEPADGKYPVVVFGQGYNYESPITNYDLCEYLASRGFIVVTSPLTGLHSPSANLTPEDLEAQIRDMEFAASFTMRLPFAEQGKLAAAGFDLGGLSSAMLAMRNPMIKALVSLDAGIIFRHNLDLMEKTTGFNPGRITASILHFTSPTSETEAMGAKEDYSLWKSAAGEKMNMVRIPGMRHADFTSYALFDDKQPVAGYWDDTSEDSFRKYLAVCRAVGDFLDAVLKNDGKNAAFGEAQLKDIFKGIPIIVEPRSNEPQRLTLDDFLNLVYGDKSEAACKIAMETWKSYPEAEFLKERFLNNLGYRLLYFSGTPKAALDVFRLNAETHPASSNAFDSLGEAYLTLGDSDLAIQNYKKSLELDPKNDNARKMLERLQRNN